MRNNQYFESADMSTYIRWVLKDKLRLTEKEIKENFMLVSALAKVEFVWRHPFDENRAKDGLELRDDFEYETGEFLDKSSGLPGYCTFFEMLAGLAIRCENQLMRNSLEGDRTSKWFFEFLDNLEILGCKRSDIIEKRCEDFMAGKFEMFPLKDKNSMRNEQIWKKLMAYINENYVYDDNIPLYRSNLAK